MNDKLDVFKILGEQRESDQLDVFKILGAESEASKILTEKMRQNQEQQVAPDFDLLQAQRQQQAPPKPAAPKPATPEPAPPKPAPAPKPALPKPAPPPTPAPPKPAPSKLAPAAKPASRKKAADSKRQPVPRPDKPPRSRGIFWGIVKAIVLIMAVLLFVAFILTSMKVQNDSMAPSINKGDKVIINKLAKSYARGDVIVFKDSSDQKYIARIVARNGDFVDIRENGGLYINNKPEEREFITGKTVMPDENTIYPVIVDEDQYFVIGDNREDSMDSRNYQIGTIDEKQIVGKVVYCIKKTK